VDLSYSFSTGVMRSSYAYMLQNCVLSGRPENAHLELKTLGLDAVAWFFPDEAATAALKQLAASGFPVAVIGNMDDGISVRYYDNEAYNYEVAKLLLAEGRRKIMLALGMAQLSTMKS